MFKLLTIPLATALSLATPAAAQAALGPDASSCRADAKEPAVLVNVTGFKSKTGRVRVQLYGSEPGAFLAKGKWLRRVDLPVTASSMPICIAAPSTGRFAVAVRHDVDGNNRTGWNDGGGFSNNPKLSVLKGKPSFPQVAIAIGEQVKPLNIVLNYRDGLAIKPVGRN